MISAEPSSWFPEHPGADTVQRIRTRLGEAAASSFLPLFQHWVSSGYIGGSNFSRTGDDIVGQCIRLGGLKAQDRMLDIGCGIGRVTVPLLDYLAQSGSYEGIDLIASGIDWLRRYVTPRFPAFQFRQAGGTYNGLYNPGGCEDPAEAVLPYPPGSFDFSLSISVFTHMTPPGVSRYLAQIGRALKPGGRLLCTAYLLDASMVARGQCGNSAVSFPHDRGNHRLRDVSLAESAVALEECHFLESAGEAGLRLAATIQRGSWRQAEGFHTGQDIVLLERSPG